MKIFLRLPNTLEEPEFTAGLSNEGSLFIDKNGNELLRINANGDFFVRDKKVINDMELYIAFKEFLEQARGK